MAHVGSLLQALGRSQPDKTAILEPTGRSLSFGELADSVARLAGGMHARGLRPGHRVVLLPPMGIGLYQALLALLQAGATAVLVDPSAGIGRVQEALARVGVHGLVGTPRAQLLRLVSPALRGGVLYASDAWSLVPAVRLSRLAGEPVEPTSPPPGEPALLTFTTGTTGAPRPMGRSHAFLLAQHRILAGHMQLGPQDVDLPTLPVFLLNSLAAGATAVLPDGDLRDVSSLDPQRIAGQLREHRVTTSSGSPAFFGPLVEHILARGEALEGLQRLFVGGARVPLALLSDMQQAFPSARIEVVYGSTEAEPMATLEASEALSVQGEGACVGRPVPGLDLRLLDPDQLEPVPEGEAGEVVVCGQHVNTGYYGEPEGSSEGNLRLDDRVWHRTGDAAWRDSQGRLWLVGRVSQRVCGRYPFPVEQRVEALDRVRRAALVEVAGRAVLAFSGEASIQEVGAVAGSDEVVHLPEIPVDPRHRAKVDRQALVELLRGRRL